MGGEVRDWRGKKEFEEVEEEEEEHLHMGGATLQRLATQKPEMTSENIVVTRSNPPLNFGRYITIFWKPPKNLRRSHS